MNPPPCPIRVREDRAIYRAMKIVEARCRVAETVVDGSDAMQDLFCLRMTGLEHEVFDVAFLTASHGLLAVERLFTGTITETAVHPREVVKAALRHNAASVVVAHNHPSGRLVPSPADHSMTEVLRRALALVDVRLLDHVLVCGAKSLSFGATTAYWPVQNDEFAEKRKKRLAAAAKGAATRRANRLAAAARTQA